MPLNFIGISTKRRGEKNITLSRKSESESRSTMSVSLQPHGLYRPQYSPGQSTGVGSLSLLQGIFSTQESKQGLLQLQVDYLPTELSGKPMVVTRGPAKEKRKDISMQSSKE